jgi:hypothetical protein
MLGLFDVLEHFTDAFDSDFHINDAVCDGGAVGFGADGIDFAEHFLADEFEFSALGGVSFEESAELFDVASEAGDFFVDIAAIGEDSKFADEVHFGDGDIEVGDEAADAFEEFVAVFDDDGGCEFDDGAELLFDGVALEGEVDGHGVAFAPAKIFEVIQCFVKAAFEFGPECVELGVIDVGFDDDTGEWEQGGEGHVGSGDGAGELFVVSDEDTEVDLVVRLSREEPNSDAALYSTAGHA